jgi:hypothetical protein
VNCMEKPQVGVGNDGSALQESLSMLDNAGDIGDEVVTASELILGEIR